MERGISPVKQRCHLPPQLPQPDHLRLHVQELPVELQEEPELLQQERGQARRVMGLGFLSLTPLFDVFSSFMCQVLHFNQDSPPLKYDEFL